MSRSSDYSIKDEQEKYDILKEEALKKYQKEGLNPSEMVVVCESFFPGIRFNEKTIRNNIKKICVTNSDFINEEFFKDEKGNYFVPPEIQELFIIILVYGMADKRKKEDPLQTKKETIITLLEAVDKYFTDEDKEYLSMTPLYNISIMERQLINRISKDISELLFYAGSAESIIRPFLLYRVSKKINGLKKKTHKKAAHEWVRRHVFDATSFDPLKFRDKSSKDDIVEKLFFSKNWQEFFSNLIVTKLLKEKTKGKNFFKFEPYELSCIAKCYNFTPESKELLEKMSKELELGNNSLDNFKKYYEVECKIKEILDINNPIEKELYSIITCYFYNMRLVEKMTPKEYDNIRNFIQLAYNNATVTFEDLTDSLYKFCND